MMFRLVLFLILAVFVARAVWRIYDSFLEGLGGRPPRSRPPQRGVQMARDPVCGTFVIPDHAVALLDGPTRVFFCSKACRDKYRARTA
jgi:YHS domain-containing protein